MRKAIGLALSLAVAGVAAPALAEPVDGFATADVNIRSGRGVDSPVIGNIIAGAKVRYDNCADNWCEVDAFGGKGYVASAYLSDKPPPERRAVRRSGRYYAGNNALGIFRSFVGAIAAQPRYGYYYEPYGYYYAPPPPYYVYPRPAPMFPFGFF